ncbi:MAG: proline iminopeptidase [Cryptosporangiaceae bacterium]|nr:proline iminopeptidase [Cryptosporangiaceae bacterium]
MRASVERRAGPGPLCPTREYPVQVVYPEIDPYETGYLDTGDGNLVYWEACGNPAGKPALYLHGGPGSGASAYARRYFDPARYRIVLFDQRGCGRSEPRVSDPAVSLEHNTTWHLTADIELLREHLGVERWLVYGISWGSVLGLAYAQQHPCRVSELVIASVTAGRRRETGWITRDMGRVLPEQWERFRDGVPEADRDGDLPTAYARLLASADPAIRDQAASDWCDWEDAHVNVLPGYGPDPRYADPVFRMTFARLVTHYWSHGSWLEEGQLLREAGKLAGIPGVLVHGRLDVSSPLETAWALAKTWPDAELTIAGGVGHSAGDPGISDVVVAALDRFAAGHVPEAR